MDDGPLKGRVAWKMLQRTLPFGFFVEPLVDEPGGDEPMQILTHTPTQAIQAY